MSISGPGSTPYGGHAGPVLSVAVAPDGSSLASGGSDGMVQVWDARTGQQQFQLAGHRGPVHSLAYSADGTLASAGQDGTVWIWNPRTGEKQQLTTQPGPIYAVAYAPDGAALATAGDDGRLRIWDTGTGQLSSDRSGDVSSVAFAPDGATLASAGADGIIRIWSSQGGPEQGQLPGRTDEVYSIAYSPEGTTLASAGSDGTIRIWRQRDGTWTEPHLLTGHVGRVWSVAYAPDGATLASAGDDGTIRIWRQRDGTWTEPHLLTGHIGRVWSVAYAPDGATLASAGNDGTIRLWDPKAGRVRDQLTGHAGEVRPAVCVLDGDALATGGHEDGTIRIWDLRNGQQQCLLAGHTGEVRSIAVGPGGTTIASAGSDGAVLIWRLKDRSRRRLDRTGRAGHTDGHGVGSVAYAPDGHTLATGDDQGAVCIWDASDGKLKVPLTGHGGAVHAVAYSPDGQTLASAGSDGKIRIWQRHDGDTWKEQRQLAGHVGGVRSVTYAPDGNTLASGGDDGTVWIWDARTGRRMGWLTGHSGAVHSMAYAPDGITLATAGYDGTPLIRDVRTGQERQRLTGHTGAVHSIIYAHGGETLITAGDTTIRIWNSRNGAQIGGTGFGLPRMIDRPLAGVRNDAPSRMDLIAATPDVQMLADLIAAGDTAPPLAIALIGEWGAGKSSVMLQIEQRVEVLATMSRHNLGNSLYAGNIRQVHFNAWHYCDDRLWSGLVDHLFRTLAMTTPDTPDPDPGPDAAPAQRAMLKKRMTRLETEKKHLDDALKAAKDTRQQSGFLAGIGSPVYLARIAAASFRDLMHNARDAWLVLLTWAALGAVAYAAWSAWGALAGAVAAALTAVLAPTLAIGQKLRHWHQKAGDIATGLERHLSERQQVVNQQLAELRERLALIDARTKLSAFLTDRASPRAYQAFRGLLGQVRSDLETLASSLADARSEWIASQSSGAAPLERIVLYIDDLDRCPPARVVEVLEAIHLMLTLDLFVVVVAVDARWLIKSLETYYQEMFSTAKRPTVIPAAGLPEPDADSGPVSPVDYLDKIFQIPYVLTTPSATAMYSYLQSLLSAAPQSTRTTKGHQAGQASASGLAGPKDSQAGNGTSQAGDAEERAGQPLPGLSAGAGSGRTGPAGDHEEEEPSRARPDPEPDTSIPELRPLRLQLSKAEIEFMAHLGSVMPTPRAAKRLANLYRLVRSGVPDAERADFIGSEAGGPYQVVQILLAILVGNPAAAQPIFHEIRRAADEEDILTVLAAASSFTEGDFCARMRSELARISGQIPVLADIAEYRRWCPTLSRYSFHTRTMTGSLLPPYGVSA